MAVASMVLFVTGACSPAHAEVYVSLDTNFISEYQGQILADGQVTQDEYRQAVSAERDCVISAGYETSEIVLHGKTLGFESMADYSNVPDSQAADQEFQQVTSNCSLEYTNVIGFVFGKDNKIPNWLERKTLWKDFGECLDDLGLQKPLEIPEAQRTEFLKEAALSAEPATALGIEKCTAQYGVLFLVNGK